MSISSTKHSPKSFISQFTLIQSSLWVLVVAGILIHGYMGRTWSAVQSFQINDSWCDLKSEGIGQHCFGDFGLPYYRGMKDMVYEYDNLAATNTPLTALFFEILRLMSYNAALLVYVFLFLACIAIPFLVSKSSESILSRFQMLAFCGILTTGAISALDRGNHVVLLIPLLYFFVIAIDEGRWNRAALILLLISLLKFWGIIFIIALIARKKWLHSLIVSFATPTITLLLLWAFPGSLPNNLRNMLAMVTNRDYSNSIAGYSISIVGFLRRIACAISSADVCNTKSFSSSFLSSTFFSFCILILLVILVLVLMRVKNVPTHLWAAMLVGLGFLGVPDAPVYNLSLTVVVIAIIAKTNVGFTEWKLANSSLFLALLVSNTPITLYSNSVSRFSSTSGDTSPIFRSDYWLIPFVWILFIIGLTYDLVGHRFIKNNYN
jgi:hypothetical protein